MTFELWIVEHCVIMMVVAVELFQLYCIVWGLSPLLNSWQIRFAVCQCLWNSSCMGT